MASSYCCASCCACPIAIQASVYFGFSFTAVFHSSMASGTFFAPK